MDCLHMNDTATEVIAHIKALLLNGKAPTLPEHLRQLPDMAEVHDYLTQLRRQLTAYSRGDFSVDVRQRGVLAGTLKSLQANMRHLIWQMERVQEGKLTRRVDFMGEFSSAFNGMVDQLDDALTTLRVKEEELLHITGELEREVEKRGAALSALQEREENLKYLAEHDPLTSLLNRRSFFNQAELGLARNSIMSTPCCVAIMDVDHFKSFNDNYGHHIGDAALRHLAAISSDQLRNDDIMGRLGGEEFIFFFGSANLDRGTRVAERIRTVIADTPIETEGLSIPVTASFGVVAIPPNLNYSGNIIEAAVRMADQALYEAKDKGRNRVCTTSFDFDDDGNISACPYIPGA